MIDKLKELIKKVMPDINVEGVNEESKLKEDLEFDSLGMMMLAMAIEDEFGVDINDEDGIRKIRTRECAIGDLVAEKCTHYFLIQTVISHLVKLKNLAQNSSQCHIQLTEKR